MHDVNLIPAERLAGRRRKRRLCLWTALCAAYGVLLLGSALLLHLARATEDRSVTEELSAIRRRVNRDNQTMLELRRELAEATAALETARAIREQPDWSKLFLGLAEQLGEEVVISRCQLTTVTPDGRLVADGWNQAAPGKPVGEFLTECQHRLALSGFGKTQDSVSRFVLRLEGVGAFELVRLANSCRQTFLDGEAVAFSVECHF